DRDRDALATVDRLVLDPRAVDAAQVLQVHAAADVQARVVARRQRIVDADLVGLAATDGDAAVLGQVIGAVGIGTDDEQKQSRPVGICRWLLTPGNRRVHALAYPLLGGPVWTRTHTHRKG